MVIILFQIVSIPEQLNFAFDRIKFSGFPLNSNKKLVLKKHAVNKTLQNRPKVARILGGGSGEEKSERH